MYADASWTRFGKFWNYEVPSACGEASLLSGEINSFFVAPVRIFTGDRQNPLFSRQETQVATTKPEEESQSNLGIISRSRP